MEIDTINSNLTYTSNSNGKCWKFPNGMQICTKTVTFGSVACSTAWGSVYETASLSLGNFAVAFLETPVINVSIVGGGQGYYAGFIEYIINSSKTSPGSVIICRPVSGNAAFKLDVIAIGRWK